MTTIDQQLFELMVRAPDCPKWFEPDMGEDKEPQKWPELISGMIYESLPPTTYNWSLWNIRRKKQCLIQWPMAYARMVMEAAGKGDKHGDE